MGTLSQDLALSRRRVVFKTTHACTTPDSWSLSLVRTRLQELGSSEPPHSSSTTPQQAECRTPTAPHSVESLPPGRYPVLLVPGLGSSAKFSFDVDPATSLVDWLARRGWDVWMAELRGNGRSDKSLIGVRSRWWNIDDNAEKDLPAIISAVCEHTGAPKLHALGHSMGGMIMTRVLSFNNATSARVHSCVLLGSGCFLQGSWWQAMEAGMGAAAFLYSVPAGAALSLYSNFAFTGAGSGFLDRLYFYPANTSPERARLVLGKNFSAISPGVILQLRTAFWKRGLLTMQKGVEVGIPAATKLGTAPGANTQSTKQWYSQVTGDRAVQLLPTFKEQTNTSSANLAVTEASVSKSKRVAYADPEALSRVKTPIFALVGDRDRMCPPQGVKRTFEMFTGSTKRRFTELGPASGAKYHYGHFDILMGNHVHEEVFPKLDEWLLETDEWNPGALPPAATSTAVDTIGVGYQSMKSVKSRL